MAATPHRSSPTPLRLLPQIRNPNGAPLRSSARLSALSRDSLPFPAPPPPSSASTRISPAVLFTVVILALIFFISGLLHLLVRSLIKKRPSSSAAASFSSSPYSTVRRRAANLRQLFRLHDSGLDQAFIDSLPLFLYREILGSKEPFDCAVCLCEFEPDDKLRLLPVCGHAFHLNCIDTWLLSNSTCPLCRGAIFAHGLTVENPIFNLNDSPEEEAEGDEAVCEKRVLFPVRLGKLKKVSVDDDDDDDDDCGGDVNGGLRGEVGETSSNNLDARRCFSMGYFQYVVSDSDLQVDLRGSTTSNDGKRLGIRRDESFSVSKIWQWSDKKGKFPMWSDAAALDGGLPWIRSSVEDI